MTWQISEWKGRVLIAYDGHLTKQDAIDCIREFRRVIDGREVVDIVIDASNMSGYDPGARALWQDTILSPSVWPRIRSTYLVGAKATLVRMAFSVLGLVTKKEIRSVSTLAEVLSS